MNRCVISACGALVLACGTLCAQQVVPGAIVLQIDDSLTLGGQSGYAVTALNTPYTNPAGEVGFAGTASNGLATVPFVWVGNSVRFSGLDAPLGTTLGGIEGTCGIGA
ncbi:MAG: hypothetical protein ACOYN0_02455, partial [Phycisphaerales bacterium]